VAGCQPYLVSPPELAPDFAAALDGALGACRAAAFRLQVAPDGARGAAALQEVCAGRTAFLIQDDVALALALGADGVHLRDPAGVAAARARLGPDRILGASCGRSRHAAMLAGDDGADYIAFGEPGCALQPPVLELVTWWSELFVLPCLAEGAFDDGSCAPLVGAGADFIAVGAAVWDHPDGAAAGAGRIQEAIAGAERRSAETTS
jgi:thiamine-phosphate pyrophosphorylase